MHHQVPNTEHKEHESTGEVLQDGIPTEKVYKAVRTYNNVQFVIANGKVCQGRNFDILIYVFSAARNFDQRLAIRATWGNKTVLKDVVKLVYIIGRASTMRMQKRIEEESNKFHDIVQGDFEDSYYGLGNKSITSWNWICMYCHTAKVFMKADDDLALDIERITKSVRPHLNKPRHLMCFFQKTSVVMRNKTSKFYVSHNEYPDKIYPEYCNGWVFMFTADIVEETCRYMAQTEMFKIEDVWTTGIVMQKVQNLTRMHMPVLLGIYSPHRAILHRSLHHQ